MAFKFAYRLGGENGTANPKEYPIATTTAIELGEVTMFTPGTGVVAGDASDTDSPQLGVAAEPHDGATAGRQVGTNIRIYSDPNDVFSLKPSNVITATGGSTTTFVDSSLLPATNNLWKGGYIEVVTCAADSSMIGKMIPITASTGSGGTITFATQPAAFASGDTAYLYPGKLAIGEYGWDLDADGTDIDFETSGGEAIQLVDADPEKKLSYWKFRLHQFASHPIAV